MMQRSCHEIGGLKERLSGLIRPNLQLFSLAGAALVRDMITFCLPLVR